MKTEKRKDLFGDIVVQSISYNEQEIITNILELHCGGQPIDCDPTYSIGNFYKHREKPKHKFDIKPQAKDVVQASADNLPLQNKSVNVIMFDPPFVIAGQTFAENDEGSSIIAKRFFGFKDFDELKKMYFGSLVEFYRVLKTDGTLIFKCQDVVSSGKNHFTHNMVMNMAMEIGYNPKDLFILMAKNRINSFNGTKWKTQQHARKHHCYFWVFKKQRSIISYTLQ